MLNVKKREFLEKKLANSCFALTFEFALKRTAEEIFVD
jgi:hypothetical protein